MKGRTMKNREWREQTSRVTITLRQADTLVDMFGGDPETVITVSAEEYGHSGPGLYAHFTEYPDEGSIFLGEES